jgi:hypothetical protein
MKRKVSQIKLRTITFYSLKELIDQLTKKERNELAMLISIETKKDLYGFENFRGTDKVFYDIFMNHPKKAKRLIKQINAVLGKVK